MHEIERDTEEDPAPHCEGLGIFHNVRDLIRFLAVAERGNILVAADQLGMTQPALSYAISRVEKRFGAPLFERHNQGVRLTALGAAAAEWGRRVLREIEEAEAHMAALREGRGGTLTVAAGAVFLQALLPPAIGLFHEAHPDVEVVLLPAAGADALKLIAVGEADLYCGALRPGALPPAFRREALPAMPAGIVACRGHPLQGRHASWEDLAAYPWLDPGDGLRRAGDQPALARLLAEIRRRAGRPVRGLVRAGPAGLFLLETGPYLTQLPLGLLDRLPGSPLAPIMADAGAGTVRADLVTRRGRSRLPALHRLLEAVREAAAAMR